MEVDCDALVVGAGVAGTATAILLARAGWRVTVVEQHPYPRRKVCGECIAPGNLALLDELGVGAEFRDIAGPELRQVGWMDAAATVMAGMPVCTQGAYPYGRALGRDRLDALLLQRARAVGVQVLQPVRVRSVAGETGDFACAIAPGATLLRAPIVVDAHGSWERGPSRAGTTAQRAPHRGSDLLAFKANFRNTQLAPGFLPVLAFAGGYGGMVVGDGGRTTVACCIRRDALTACRAQAPGVSAGIAVESLLRRACHGVGVALEGSLPDGPWLSVGPLRPGVRLGPPSGPFRVGNAAGESHPLIGEGISMALQSAALLAAALLRHPPAAIAGPRAVEVHRGYASAWRRAFVPRLRLAAVYAHVAMRPALAAAARTLLLRWPVLLSGGARLAGKAARAAATSSPSWSTHEHA